LEEIAAVGAFREGFATSTDGSMRFASEVIIENAKKHMLAQASKVAHIETENCSLNKRKWKWQLFQWLDVANPFPTIYNV
jgi:hypothetical protein